MSAMELKPPTRKGFKVPPNHSPLPISLEDDYEWPIFTGQYNGTSVIIDDINEIITLSKKGYFGKGSLSKGCPSTGKRRALLNVLCESQWKRRKHWAEMLSDLLSNSNHAVNTSGVEEKKTLQINEEHENSSEKNRVEVNLDVKSSEEISSVAETMEVGFAMEVENQVAVNLEADVAPSDLDVKKSCETGTIIDDEKVSIAVDFENKTIGSNSIGVKKSEEINTFAESQKAGKDSKVESLDIGNDGSNFVTSFPERKPIDDSIKNEMTSNSTAIKCSRSVNSSLKANEVLVIADLENNFDDYISNLNPHIEIENIKTVVEVLYLSLEEAFFLSYALNCLQIFDLRANYLTIKDMWVLFQQSQPDFIEKYVAYHYFRAKGWVVKSGIKFGGDFLLYKKGPQFYHASYIVIVQTLNPDGSNCNKNTFITWKRSVALNRLAESATKELLICQVMRPEVKKEQLLDPEILKEFKVSETLLRRWHPTSEKEKGSH